MPPKYRLSEHQARILGLAHPTSRFPDEIPNSPSESSQDEVIHNHPKFPVFTQQDPEPPPSSNPGVMRNPKRMRPSLAVSDENVVRPILPFSTTTKPGSLLSSSLLSQADDSPDAADDDDDHHHHGCNDHSQSALKPSEVDYSFASQSSTATVVDTQLYGRAVIQRSMVANRGDTLQDRPSARMENVASSQQQQQQHQPQHYTYGFSYSHPSFASIPPSTFSSSAPSSQQPASQHPASQQPASPQPASQQPASQQPASQQPASQQPASQQQRSTTTFSPINTPLPSSQLHQTHTPPAATPPPILLNPNTSFPDILVYRPLATFSFHAPSSKITLPCTHASPADTMRLRRRAGSLFAYAESDSIFDALGNRVERMVAMRIHHFASGSGFGAPSFAASKAGAVPVDGETVVSACARRLRDWLKEKVEERVELGECRGWLVHEVEWAEWFVEAADKGVLHLKVEGCECRPSWEDDLGDWGLAGEF